MRWLRRVIYDNTISINEYTTIQNFALSFITKNHNCKAGKPGNNAHDEYPD